MALARANSHLVGPSVYSLGMQLLFVDESGTPPKPGRPRPHYFVVGGVIIPENAWPRLRDAILGMKVRRKIRGEFKWRYFAPHNDEPENPMRHLGQSDRDSIRTEVYGIMGAKRSLKSLAAVCSIRAAYRMASVNTQDDIYHLTYKAITERFQYHLQDLSKESGRREYGIIIGDPRGGSDDKHLRAHHQKLLHSSAEFISTYKNLIESLFFQPSNLSIGIQFADVMAGAVWRKYERNDQRWYELIEPTLRRNASGEVDGFGLIKVPKRNWI